MACHKTRFNPPFFHKIPCTKSGKWPLLHYSSFLRVLHFNVMSLLCRSSLIFDTFPSVLVCNPNLFFLYRFMNFLKVDWSVVIQIPFSKSISILIKNAQYHDYPSVMSILWYSCNQKNYSRIFEKNYIWYHYLINRWPIA